ncbi:MAG: hypothetical protein ACOZNI_20985 [Myxococcota bacterium]
MTGLLLLLGAAPWPPPTDTPLCGHGLEASVWLRERTLRPPAPPPSSSRGLPSAFSVERRGDLVVMRDMAGDAFGRDGLGYEGMYDALVYFYELFPDEFDFVTVITNQDSTYGMGAFAFYSPLANDARGIGDRIYDSGMTVQGLLFMNAWQYWSGQSDTFTSAVFGQELGHRWGSYVHYDLGDGDRDDILGRDDGHWSYWLETSNSPMEGNTWTDNGDGTFTLDAGEEVAYSDLDLYLMGLIGPEDVAPFYLIADPSGLARNASSSPEYYASGRDQTASGTRVDITIDDVIRAEGARDPAAGEAQTAFRMAVVLVLADDEQPDDEAVEGADEARARFVEVWEEDTLGLATLDTSLGDTVVDPLAPDLFAGPLVVPKAAW